MPLSEIEEAFGITVDGQPRTRLHDVRERLGLPIDGPRPPRETQDSICKWVVDTFGTAGTNLAVAVRTNEEMAELLAKLRDDDDDIEAAIEAADVIICLLRIFERLGLQYTDVLDAKMELNRRREWNLTGTGHGYHK